MSQGVAPSPLTAAGRWIVLVVALLGWFGSGVDMAITQLVGRSAMIDLLDRAGALDAKRYQQLNKRFGSARPAKDAVIDAAEAAERKQLAEWRSLVGSRFARLMCAFLFGAAAGGLLFGWMGDRYGRARGMAASILAYSAFAGAAYFAQSPGTLVVCWFFACLGVGGMWPNGVALLSEAWSGASRSMISGVLGVSANVGLFLMNTLATLPGWAVTPDAWRWAMLIGAAPLVLGLFAWFFVPESPRWLALQRGAGNDAAKPGATAAPPASMAEVFRAPLLSTTLLAIVLATIPMMGGWGSSSWMQPWAAEVGEAASPPDLTLQARVGQVRALPGMIGSLLGGWIAVALGRHLTFFLVSLGCLAFAETAFCLLVPTDPWFLPTVGALGFCSGIYYGWLPLCLPELFPTRTRSTGAGVGFNFGRIVTAVTLVATDLLMQHFHGDYAAIGRTTSLVFAVGLVVIWFAPDTSRKSLDD
jgi:SHS family sialic acid transporter-like MFS transporter